MKGQERNLGQLSVSALGLGCMPMSWAYGVNDVDPAEVRATLHEAVELGVTLFDTADVYGPYANEELLGRDLVDAGLRDRVIIATKCGLVPMSPTQYGRNGTPEHVRSACDASLSRLKIDYIDLYQLHRTDPKVPVEETWGAMSELVVAGKVRHIGLSEANVNELSLAHAIHPLASVQSELSLWTRDALRDGVLKWCAANDVGFLAFSPLGRGFLTGEAIVIGENDFRSTNPRFTTEAMATNQRIVDAITAIATTLKITNAQLALAWVLAQGPHVVPIPGTKRRKWLRENMVAAEITLSEETLSALEKIPESIAPRY